MRRICEIRPQNEPISMECLSQRGGFAAREGDLRNMFHVHCVYLGGGFKHCLCSPLFGGMIQFDYRNIFQLG